MLSNDLISTQYPTIDLLDKVSLALQLMDDYDIQHLPVLSEEKFVGLISKDDLLDTNEDAFLKSLDDSLIRKAVQPGDHFLAALKMTALHTLSLVPVVSTSHEWIGAIPVNELIRVTSSFLGTEEPGAVIVLELERKNYSFGEINRLVETNNAVITQLNTSMEPETGLMIVTMKINKTEVSDIIATFQRYEYVVRFFVGEEEYENELQHNYNHLLSYLKM